MLVLGFRLLSFYCDCYVGFKAKKKKTDYLSVMLDA